jgi:L-amino acid N-acyltransferase YncA
VYRIERFAANDLPLLLPLLRSYSLSPYRAFESEFGRAAISELFVAQTQEKLLSPDTRAWCALEGKAVCGLVAWRNLADESQCLGRPAASIDCLIAGGDYAQQRGIKGALLRQLLAGCADEGVCHLGVRVDAADMSAIHSLQDLKFILVDGLLIYVRNLPSQASPWPEPSGCQVRLASAADVPRLKALARSIYSYDRLHSDPAIPKAVADEIYGLWVEKSCAGRAGDAVFVAVDGDDILGYSVSRVDRTVEPYLREPLGIWVIAGVAAQARSRGVGRCLCYAMLDWQRAQGVRVVQGGTQLANIASARMHESCGFRIAGSSVSMSKWLPGSVERG